jgi:hypothetical protein
MLEKQGEKILLAVVLLLLAVFLVDRVSGWLWTQVDDINRQTEKLKAELSLVDLRGDQGRQMDQVLEGFKSWTAGSVIQRQTAFRKYLEQTVGAHGTMESVLPLAAAEVPGLTQLRTLGFQLRLRLRLSDLYAMLSELDGTEQPVQIRYLRITPADPVSRSLLVEMTVATLAKGQEESQ